MSLAPTHRITDPSPNGGDPVERLYWPTLRERFSQYEHFWSAIVWDMTLRPYENIQLRSDIPDELKIIASAHYTLFKRLAFIDAVHNAQPGTFFNDFIVEDQLSRFIYTSFGTIRDMIGKICFLTAALEDRRSGKTFSPFTKDELLKKWPNGTTMSIPRSFPHT